MAASAWLFEGKPISDDQIKGFAGFVYLITNLQDGRKYVGRKYFSHYRRKSKKKRRVSFESDWRDYYGSNEELLEDVKRLGPESFKREILVFCKTRGDVNYNEVRLQFQLDVLEKSDYYNQNIQGKIFRKPSHITEARKWNMKPTVKISSP